MYSIYQKAEAIKKSERYYGEKRENNYNKFFTVLFEII